MTESRGPKGKGADVRGELLRAGCALYTEQGPEGFSLRRVAERAGVNQAMVRYYFADKHGFEGAMMDFGFDQLLDRLPHEGDFEAFLTEVISALSTMPWLPLLMLSTVYISDVHRERFLEKHAPRVMGELGARLKLRDDVDPVLGLLSMISMIVLPHLGRPIVSRILDVHFDEQFATAYAAHITTLLNPDRG